MKPYEKKGNEEIESENHSLKQTKSANSQLETDTHTHLHIRAKKEFFCWWVNDLGPLDLAAQPGNWKPG